MPLISSFFGITIYMYFLPGDHNPPHIHVYYGEHNATINIETEKIIEGSVPSNTLKLTIEWLRLHKTELKNMWNTQKFSYIKPLDKEKKYVS